MAGGTYFGEVGLVEDRGVVGGVELVVRVAVGVVVPVVVLSLIHI